MSAVQNLKSKCAAVATPITTPSTTHDVCAAVKPVSRAPATPPSAKVCTPQQKGRININTTPKTSSDRANLSANRGTPQTPISSQSSVSAVAHHYSAYWYKGCSTGYLVAVVIYPVATMYEYNTWTLLPSYALMYYTIIYLIDMIHIYFWSRYWTFFVSVPSLWIVEPKTIGISRFHFVTEQCRKFTRL